jgi:cytochrome c oxidase assembly protein subunit 15
MRIRPLPAKLLLLALITLFIQIFLGAWVSTNYAVLACPDFPTCLGAAWPETNWSEGFTLWRQLGLNAQGEYISPVALQTIHWAHRLFAIVLFITLSVVGVRALRASNAAVPELGRFARLLFSLLTLQILTGISNVVFQWPLAAALLHTAGSAALVFCLVRMSYWASWKSPIRMQTAKL